MSCLEISVASSTDCVDKRKRKKKKETKKGKKKRGSSNIAVFDGENLLFHSFGLNA